LALLPFFRCPVGNDTPPHTDGLLTYPAKMGTQDGLSVGGMVADTYRVTRLLGRGGMGAVWAAEHLRLPGRQVAVKVLLSPGVASGEAFARFRREAEIASRLGHPHIVQVLDFHTLPTGEPYIILELLQGETLAQRLQRGPVPLEETLTITRQVGSALQAAHRAGVVHRDLKPDNVFLCTPQEEMPGPNVKVLDFGISKIRGSQTVATQDAVLMGTPQYMAPEQALGKNTSIDARTDVFALGAIVYEMLSGTPAFAGSSLAEVVYKVVHAQPQPLAQLRTGLPLNVLSAVDRALQKDTAHRPPDVSAFVAELTGRPLTVPSTSPHSGVLDATLASPAPIPLSNAETDATFTPATPVALPRVTDAMPTAPVRPWATPPVAASPPSAWPAVAPGVPTPRAELITAKESQRLARVPPTQRRRVARWIIAALALLAVFGVFRRARHADVASAMHLAQSIAKQGQELVKEGEQLAPPNPPATPGTPEAENDDDDDEDTPEVVKKSLDGVKDNIRRALEAASAGSEKAKADKAKAAAAKEQRAAAAVTPSTGSEPPEVTGLLAGAEGALSGGDPKTALHLADQSFYSQKTSAGWAIKARAYCQLKDLGNARAALGNVTGKAERAKVVSDCKQQGVNLR
jgi:eukaryotic-like serine/threonine-protein kinase